MKTISMTGPVPALQAMSIAIQGYADAAYPLGGSDCAQTARAGLLDTAEKIDQQVGRGQTGNVQVTISRRIKSHIKAAIQYYLQVSAEQALDTERAEKRGRLLLALLNGQTVQGTEWQ